MAKSKKRARFRDFDAFFKTQNKDLPEPVTFNYGGESFELPAALPAAIPIKAMRLQQEYETETDIPPSEVVVMAEGLFGRDQLDRLLATGISADKLGEVLRWAFVQYGDNPEGETSIVPKGNNGESGNPEAPEQTGVQTSSKTGTQ